MPFTPAHIALVTPIIRKKYLSATALVIGSMVPDFEYFFKLSVDSEFSHTLPGILYFDVPVTFLLAWIFLRFVRSNLISNLPLYIQMKMQQILALDTREVLIGRLPVFVASALIGALSHLFWDAFTHNNTIFTSNLAFYKGTYIPYDGVKYPLWYALQHISTAVGLLVMLAYLISIRPQSVVSLREPGITYWICIVLITAVTVWLRFTFHPSDMKEGNVIVSTISGFCIALVICGLLPFNNPQLRNYR